MVFPELRIDEAKVIIQEAIPVVYLQEREYANGTRTELRLSRYSQPGGSHSSNPVRLLHAERRTSNDQE